MKNRLLKKRQMSMISGSDSRSPQHNVPFRFGETCAKVAGYEGRKHGTENGLWRPRGFPTG